MTGPAAPAKPTPQMDPDWLDALLGRVIGDLGATTTAGGVVVGTASGLYTALAQGTATPDELAGRTGTDPRYVAEWLAGQAAGGYVEYDPATGAFHHPRAGVRPPTRRPSTCRVPSCSPSALRAEPRITEAFRTGAGMGWHEHDDDVFLGCELLFRPGYTANLVASWLPALDGVEDKLRAAAGSPTSAAGWVPRRYCSRRPSRGDRVGVGLPRGLRPARPQAGRRGGRRGPGERRDRAPRRSPEPATTSSPPSTACTTWATRLARPAIRAALAADGTLDGGRAAGRRHRRGQPQSGRSRLLRLLRSSACPTPAPSPAATASAPRPVRPPSGRSPRTPGSPGSAGRRRRR